VDFSVGRCIARTARRSGSDFAASVYMNRIFGEGRHEPWRVIIYYEQGRGFVIQRVESFWELVGELQKNTCVACAQSFVYDSLDNSGACDRCMEMVYNIKETYIG
jgi:hypothetical protein